MFFDEGKSKFLLGPKNSLMKVDDEESSLKRCEQWLGDYQESTSFVFKVGRGFEDRMVFEGVRSSFGWLPRLEEQE